MPLPRTYTLGTRTSRFGIVHLRLCRRKLQIKIERIEEQNGEDILQPAHFLVRLDAAQAVERALGLCVFLRLSIMRTPFFFMSDWSDCEIILFQKCRLYL